MAPQRKQQQTTVGEMQITDLQILISDAVQAAIKPVTESVRKLEKEMTKMREDMVQLQGEIVKRDKEIRNLKCTVEMKLDEREQYSRRNNLRIFGIKENNDEKTDEIVLGVAEKLGVKLDIYSIDRSHRIGKKGKYPRPIIVKFISYAIRSELFTRKKKLKGSGITLREDLTKPRFTLLKRAIVAYTDRCVWTSDGVIMVKSGDHKPFKVRCSDDLDSLIERHPPSSD